MKIADHSVKVKRTYKMEFSKETAEKPEVWQTRPEDEGDRTNPVDINSYAHQQKTVKLYLNSEGETVEDQIKEVKLKLIESFIYKMTGKSIKLHSPKMKYQQPGSPITLIQRNSPAQEARDNWGLIYEYQETRMEKESVQHSAAGAVTIADGRIISFKLEFCLSHAFYHQCTAALRMGSVVPADPLLVALEGGAPDLTQTREDFDFYSDGEMDQIAFAAKGGGFLSQDRDRDWQIKDGTLLFSPQSGNGFGEFKMYDLDGNGCIDGLDDVFEKFLILSVSEVGEKSFIHLGDAGFGAIYLGEVIMPYSFKDEIGDYCMMRSSSIFLRENDTAGTTRHIDLAL